MEEIREIEMEMESSGYLPNTVQRRLAEEVTLFVHGKEGLEEAIKETEALRPGSETRLDWKTIEGLQKLLESKSAARRQLKQGGLYLNNGRVDNEGKKIDADDIVVGKILLLSAGKKNKMVVRIA